MLNDSNKMSIYVVSDYKRTIVEKYCREAINVLFYQGNQLKLIYHNDKICIDMNTASIQPISEVNNFCPGTVDKA